MCRKIVKGESNLPQIERVLKIKNTLDQPVINSIFKDENGNLGFSVIKILVERFVSSFGFSTKMTESQIEMLTVDTFDKFSYDSLFDVILFFKMARSGSFGDTQRGVDSNLIYGKWFPMYMEMKSDLREKEYKKLKDERNSISVSMNDVETSYRKAIAKKIKENKQDFIIDFTKSMDRQMLEDTINSWNKDDVLKNHVTMLKVQRRVIKN